MSDMKHDITAKQSIDGEGIKSTKDTTSTTKENPPTRRGIIVNLVVEHADKFVRFMASVLGAKEYFRLAGDSGKILHLALDIDGVAVYAEELGNEFDTGASKKPHVKLHLNCDDPLAVADGLLKAGATELAKCEKQFWGAMYGQYQDPFGQIWSISNSTGALHDIPEHLARMIVPFVSVRDAAAYKAFLSKAFGAEETHPDSKDPSGKILCAEMKINGGLIMIGDHIYTTGKQESSVVISYEVATGKAMPLAKAFQDNGGAVEQEPSMQFWGQVWGRSTDPFGQMWGMCEPQVGPPPSEEDMALDIKIGAKYNWKYNWSIEDVPATHCFGEIRTCPSKGPSIAQEMKTMMPLAFAGAAKAGLTPSGPPVAAYFTWNPTEDGETNFTCGPAVAAGSPTPEGAGLGTRTVLGCKCATVVHVGPYDKLTTTYSATFEWIDTKCYKSSMPIVEVYENDPMEVEPEKLRTKICIPIVSKGETVTA